MRLIHAEVIQCVNGLVLFSPFSGRIQTYRDGFPTAFSACYYGHFSYGLALDFLRCKQPPLRFHLSITIY